MKLSFQTFCLVFLVTIVHVVMITALAPVGNQASKYFAQIDVESIFAGELPDAESANGAATPEPTSVDVSGGNGRAPLSLDEAGGSSSPGREEQAGQPDGAPAADGKTHVGGSEIVEAKDWREEFPGAITDARELADRVGAPRATAGDSARSREKPGKRAGEKPGSEAGAVSAPDAETADAPAKAKAKAEPAPEDSPARPADSAGVELPQPRPGEPVPKARSFRPLP